ncbi:cadherin repeat domain-containing protein, partial [Vibrio sinensis]
NDYELFSNNHYITVVASDGVNETPINVLLIERDVNEAPVFELPDGEEEYCFHYDENSAEEYVIGTVSALDPEGGNVTYSIDYAANDPLNGLFEVNNNGQISLTDAGVEAFTNDYELFSNNHYITVVASDGVKETPVNVLLSEHNVNEAPVAKDFNINGMNQTIIPIIFDSADDLLDRISDEDDDFDDVPLSIMITSLPSEGQLLYTDDNGETRILTEADLHISGSAVDPSLLLNPNSLVYVPGGGAPFEIGYSGDPDDIVPDDDCFYNWGVYVSDTERLVTLDNGNTIGLSLTDNNGKAFKQYFNQRSHVGYGLGDTDGYGMNKNETIVIDLSNNPLGTVNFGLDGLGGLFVANCGIYVEVTYLLADGSQHIEKYQKDVGDTGNSQLLYDFSYSSPENPIVGMEMRSNGGSWELRYLSGEQSPVDEVTFDYLAVDSDHAVSNEATVVIDTSDSPIYEVLAAANGDELYADLGNQLLVGDEQENVFQWLDNSLDSGVDVILDFELEEDIIDLDLVLDDTESADMAELLAKIGVDIVDQNIELTIPFSDGIQTIVIQDGATILDDYIAPDNSFDSIEVLTHLIKNDAA